MTWDAFQREMLAALGHTLYVMADSPVMQPSAGDAGRPPDRVGLNPLLHALLRAANRDDDDLPSLQSRLPPLHTLAGNANAKRALWPVLRAMRAATK